MTIEEMISAYRITLADGGRIRMGNVRRVERDNALELIKTRKTEIVAHLQSKKAAAEKAAAERQAKVKEIEGLDELYATMKAAADYHEAFNRMMEDRDNDGAFPPKKPGVSPAEISAKYPRAAAYVRAENWASAAHYAKSAAGQKALEAIINGADPDATIKAMEAEWTAHCTDRIWD